MPAAGCQLVWPLEFFQQIACLFDADQPGSFPPVTDTLSFPPACPPICPLSWPGLFALSCVSVTLAHLKSLCLSYLLPWVLLSPQGPSPHPVSFLVWPIRLTGRYFSPGPWGRSPACSSRLGQRVCQWNREFGEAETRALFSLWPGKEIRGVWIRRSVQEWLDAAGFAFPGMAS